MRKSLLRVKVNPRSSRNRIVGWQEDVLMVKLTAPPVEGLANKACVEFLAESLGVRKSQVVLVSGHTSREKTFEIVGMSADCVRDRLGERVDGNQKTGRRQNHQPSTTDH